MLFCILLTFAKAIVACLPEIFYRMAFQDPVFCGANIGLSRACARAMLLPAAGTSTVCVRWQNLYAKFCKNQSLISEVEFEDTQNDHFITIFSFLEIRKQAGYCVQQEVLISADKRIFVYEYL